MIQAILGDFLRVVDIIQAMHVPGNAISSLEQRREGPRRHDPLDEFDLAGHYLEVERHIVLVKVWVPIKRGQKAWCVDSRVAHVVCSGFDEKDIVGGIFTQSVFQDGAADASADDYLVVALHIVAR